MTKKINAPCDVLADHLDRKDGPVDLSPELLNVLAERIEEALADNRGASLTELRNQLSTTFRAALGKAPEEVINAIRGRGEALDVAGIAYALGQLGFAQLLATRADQRRPDDAFEKLTANEAYASYLRALLRGAMSVGDLANAVGERVETVSRKLKPLREMGAVDFRRQGTTILNFLTPAAEALAREAFRVSFALPKPRKALDRSLNDALNDLPSYLRAPPNFSQDNIPLETAAEA
jgi:DNA-binding transcriptional ArsR family regulator